MKDAAAVSATPWALYEVLADTGLSVEALCGGRTKYNRAQLGIPKTHALDAACVGEVATLPPALNGRVSSAKDCLDGRPADQ